MDGNTLCILILDYLTRATFITVQDIATNLLFRNTRNRPTRDGAGVPDGEYGFNGDYYEKFQLSSVGFEPKPIYRSNSLLERRVL